MPYGDPRRTHLRAINLSNLSPTIEQAICEASALPGKWPEVLEKVSSACGGFGGHLFYITANETRWAASPSVARLAPSLTEAGLSLDILLPAQALPTPQDPSLRVATESAADGRSRELGILFDRLLGPGSLGHRAFLAAYLPSGDRVVLTIERLRRLGPFSADETARLGEIAVPLLRAVGISRQRSLDHMKTVLESMSSIGVLAFAVSGSGEVAAVRHIVSGDLAVVLNSATGRLEFSEPTVEARFRASIAALADGRTTDPIAIRNEAGRVCSILHLLPLRLVHRDIFSDVVGFGAFTRTAGISARDPLLLQTLFDLTAAEAAIASQIGIGHTLEEIAARENKSVMTVRNQVKSVFAKTGCGRQVDLVLLLDQLLPATLAIR
jgi:DNA-binding CsgD family transcriptional regulator